MPESESLVSKLREYAHLECPSKPGNPAEFAVDVDVEEREWNSGRRHVIDILETEANACNAKIGEIRKRVGGHRKLTNIITFIKSNDEKEQSIDSKDVNEVEKDPWKLAYNPAHLLEGKYNKLIN